MIIEVVYITDSDVGPFESKATLDCTTGVVIEVEDCSDESSEHIDTVYREYIYFSYLGQEYELDVDFTDSVTEVRHYEKTDFYAVFQKKQMHDALQEHMPPAPASIPKVKI